MVNRTLVLDLTDFGVWVLIDKSGDRVFAGMHKAYAQIAKALIESGLKHEYDEQLDELRVRYADGGQYVVQCAAGRNRAIRTVHDLYMAASAAGKHDDELLVQIVEHDANGAALCYEGVLMRGLSSPGQLQLFVSRKTQSRIVLP